MTNPTRRRLTALVGATAVFGWPRSSLSAAEPSIRLAQTATYRDGPVPAWHQIAPPDAVVSVFRGGRLLRVSIGAELLPGDEVQCGPRAAAIIRFRDRGDVFIDADTKVRIGSLEVIFGRIFARVRGLFEVRSENVTAAVEGTRFLFEVTTERNVRVAVSEGGVVGRPRGGGWAGVSLRQGEQLRSIYPNRIRPRAVPADRRELEQWERWADQVSAATPMDAALPGLPGATTSPGGPSGGSGGAPGGSSGGAPGGPSGGSPGGGSGSGSGGGSGSGSGGGSGGGSAGTPG